MGDGGGVVIRALRSYLEWLLVMKRLDGCAMWKDGRGVRRRGCGWLVGFVVGRSTCGSRVSECVGVGVGVGVYGVGMGVGLIRSGRRPRDPL